MTISVSDSVVYAKKLKYFFGLVGVEAGGMVTTASIFEFGIVESDNWYSTCRGINRA